MFKKIFRTLFLAILLLLVGAVFWVKQPILLPQSAPLLSEKSSAENLEKYVLKVSEDFFPRSHQDIENLNALSEYIFEIFQQYEGNPEYQNYQAEGKNYRNVLARWGDPSKPKIVLGAHYDSYSKLPAADDNASGVSVVLELARLLQKKFNTDYCIELAAWPLEEPPFFRTEKMGSYVHAKSLHDDNAYVHFMISLETLGYYSDEEGSQDYPHPILNYIYPNKGNFAVIVGDFNSVSATREIKRGLLAAGSDLEFRSISAPAAVPGIDFSDHMSFWKFDIPAVMITDSAFYRNKLYHSLEDTAELLNFEKMAELTDSIYSMILNLK